MLIAPYFIEVILVKRAKMIVKNDYFWSLSYVNPC